MKIIKRIYYTIRYGEWSCGLEQYEGKPQLGFFCLYYDGWWYSLHIKQLWVCCYY